MRDQRSSRPRRPHTPHALVATKRYDLAAKAFKIAVQLGNGNERGAFKLDDLYQGQKVAKAAHLEALAEAAINCHHNYAAKEIHDGSEIYVTRKGAIRAGAGDLGIIPGSMGARSFIVRGRGNPKSFESCAHGAGRRMSRNAARKRFTRADLERQTAGVECRKDGGVIDEIPGAYKDIDTVMANQEDLVETVHTLKQVLCVKG